MVILHKDCPQISSFGESFTNLTCDACFRIP